MIRTLASSSDDGTATTYGKAMIPALALDMIDQLINEYIETANKAMIDSDDNQRALADAFLKMLNNKKAELRAEMAKYRSNINGISDALTLYARIASSMPVNLRANKLTQPTKDIK